MKRSGLGEPPPVPSVPPPVPKGPPPMDEAPIASPDQGEYDENYENFIGKVTLQAIATMDFLKIFKGLSFDWL